MIAVKAVIEIGGASGCTRSAIRNDVLQPSWLDRGKYWHRELRKRHFTLDAMARYGYQRRSKSYNRRKIKKLGAAIPLVFTGVSRALSAMGSITANSNQVSVRMPVNAFNYRPKTRNGRTPPDMQDEFRRITPDEEQEMDRRQQALIERLLKRCPKRKIKVGS